MRIAPTLLVLGTLLSAPAAGQPSPAKKGPSPLGRKIVVGTMVHPPFSFKDEDGKWDGLALDVWQRVAARLGWAYEVRELPREKLTASLIDGSVDIVATGIPMTVARERKYDFTHAYHRSGLGIAVPLRAETSWWDSLANIFSPAFGLAVLALAALALLAGTFVWLVERRANPQEFGGTVGHGIGAGFWFSAVTMTTVGYGDKAPKTVAGRVITLLWMFVSLFLVTAMSGTIASLLTVNKLDSPVRGVRDLGRYRTLVVENSVAAAALKRRKIAFQTESSLDAAFDTMVAGNADAIVDDAAALRYRAAHDLAGQVRVLRRIFDQEQYGLLVRTRSRLLESINREMLAVLTSRSWREDRKDHLGDP